MDSGLLISVFSHFLWDFKIFLLKLAPWIYYHTNKYSVKTIIDYFYLCNDITFMAIDLAD